MAGMTLEQAADQFSASREALEDVNRSYSSQAQKEAAAIMERVLRKPKFSRFPAAKVQYLDGVRWKRVPVANCIYPEFELQTS